MCGRVATRPPNDHDRWRWKLEIDRPERHLAKPRFNVAPTQVTWIVRTLDGKRLATMARWGFVPSWRRPEERGPEPINARSEGVAKSRLFGSALRKSRCIVPVLGFYEWQSVPRQRSKRPHFVAAPDGELLPLAGGHVAVVAARG